MSEEFAASFSSLTQVRLRRRADFKEARAQLPLRADSGRSPDDRRTAQIEHTGHYLGQSPGVRLAASQERAVIHSNFAGCTAASGGAEPHEMIVLWLEVATIWLAADPA